MRSAADRRRVAGGEGYEVNYFARKHGISKDQAESLKRIGDDRAELNAAAEKPRNRRRRFGAALMSGPLL
jgi:hypothetical protein